MYIAYIIIQHIHMRIAYTSIYGNFIAEPKWADSDFIVESKLAPDFIVESKCSDFIAEPKCSDGRIVDIVYYFVYYFIVVYHYDEI